MKIDQPYIPIVKQAPKTANTPHATAVPVVQGKPKRREEEPKKKSPQQSKKNPSRNPLFSSLVARELSSRLASEVHEHEEKTLNVDELMTSDLTEEEFKALQAEAESREAAAIAELDAAASEKSEESE